MKTEAFWGKVIEKTELCMKQEKSVEVSVFDSKLTHLIKDCFWSCHNLCWRTKGPEDQIQPDEWKYYDYQKNQDVIETIMKRKKIEG